MTDEDKKLLEDFLEQLKIEGKSYNWIYSLKYKIPKLYEYMEEKNLIVNNFKVADAQDYQGWLLKGFKIDGGKYKNASVKEYMKAGSAFYNYLKKKRVVYSNPFAEVNYVRPESTLPANVLREKEMNNFLAELSEYDKESSPDGQIRLYQTHVLAEVMYSTGMRISEASLLKLKNIDFNRGVINVICGKGGKNRIVFLNDYAKEVLRLYIKDMRDYILIKRNRDNDYVFGIKTSSLKLKINRVLGEISKRLGYNKLTTHSFRHSVGFHLLRAGCDIRYIQEILGHKKLATTEVYTKIEKEDLKRVLDKYHPRQFRRITNETNV